MSATPTDTTPALAWQIVLETRHTQVRRLPVPGGWLYCTEDVALRALTAAFVPDPGPLACAAPMLLDALQLVLPMAQSWADGKSRSHPDHECIDEALAAITAATSQRSSL